jgi:hypothetical protein
MVTPNIGQTTQSTYIGFGRASQWPQFGLSLLRWGNDNTGTGYESVLVNLVKFRQDYPSETNMVIDLRAFWYETVGSNPVNVAATLYKGGTMTGPTNYIFNNTTYTSKYQITSVSKAITLRTQNPVTSGQRVATLTYNLTTNTGTFNNNDTTTPSV